MVLNFLWFVLKVTDIWLRITQPIINIRFITEINRSQKVSIKWQTKMTSLKISILRR